MYAVIKGYPTEGNPNLYSIGRNPEAFLKWIGWHHLESILWFLYSIGIGIRLYRLSNEHLLKDPPPEDVEEVHQWSSKRRTFGNGRDGRLISLLFTFTLALVVVGVSFNMRVEQPMNNSQFMT